MSFFNQLFGSKGELSAAGTNLALKLKEAYQNNGRLRINEISKIKKPLLGINVAMPIANSFFGGGLSFYFDADSEPTLILDDELGDDIFKEHGFDYQYIFRIINLNFSKTEPEITLRPVQTDYNHQDCKCTIVNEGIKFTGINQKWSAILINDGQWDIS